MAKNNQYFELTKDTIEKTYTEKHLKRYRSMYPFIKMMVKLKDPERFIIQAEACSNHNAIDELSKINKPVYIIGGNKDLIAGNDSSEILHKLIKNRN
jgi:esterase/lipase